MTDIPVQEDEYDTDSERDREDDTPPDHDITVTRSGRAIRALFRLEFVRPSKRSGMHTFMSI